MSCNWLYHPGRIPGGNGIPTQGPKWRGSGKDLTRDLTSNQDTQCDSKAKGQVDGEEATVGAPAEHNLGDRATAEHLCPETKRDREAETQQVWLQKERSRHPPTSSSWALAPGSLMWLIVPLRGRSQTLPRTPTPVTQPQYNKGLWRYVEARCVTRNLRGCLQHTFTGFSKRPSGGGYLSSNTSTCSSSPGGGKVLTTCSTGAQVSGLGRGGCSKPEEAR